MSDRAPFCQSNARRWVALLIASSVLVLGFAGWLALERSEQGGQPAVGVAAANQTPPQLGPPPGPPTVAVAATPADVVSSASVRLVEGGLRPIALRNGQSPAMQMQIAFNQAADLIRPAVVNINAVRPGAQPGAQGPPRQAQFVNPFDGVPDKVIGNVAFESVGSGVIIDPAGYVVTNDHLVQGATAIMVTRFNRNNEHLSARVVAADPRSDLALLKLNGNGPYPTARLANSDRSEVGDWVLAVGNPFGLEHTVTAGIVSSRRQSMLVSGVEYRGLLQTDAPINRGSSGGPLVNLDGRVIGINTAIYAPTGVFSGTGFAIPSNRVSLFVARALSGNQRAVGRLGQPPAGRPMVGGPMAAGAMSRVGIAGIEMGPMLAAKIGFASNAGVFVSSVLADSPADNADLARGDVITDVAGWPVQGVGSLDRALARYGAGQTIPVGIWRNGKSKNLLVKLRRNGNWLATR